MIGQSKRSLELALLVQDKSLLRGSNVVGREFHARCGCRRWGESRKFEPGCDIRFDVAGSPSLNLSSRLRICRESMDAQTTWRRALYVAHSWTRPGRNAGAAPRSKVSSPQQHGASNFAASSGRRHNLPFVALVGASDLRESGPPTTVVSKIRGTKTNFIKGEGGCISCRV